MRFEARLTGEAAALARTHAALLEQLPATFHASILIELQKWATLFPAEQAYQRALLQQLEERPQDERRRVFAGIARVETEAGVDQIAVSDPVRFQDDAQATFRRRRQLPQWRKEVDTVFEYLQPSLDRALHPPDAPRRLIVQIYGSGISFQHDKLWSRFRDAGFRLPLTLDGVRGAQGFLRALFGGGASAGPRTLLTSLRAEHAPAPLDTWLIESGEALHTCCEAAAAAPSGTAPSGLGATAPTHTGLSYERLRAYRDELTRALYEKIQAGVESPQAFAAYARSLRIAPGPGVLVNAADLLQAFVRDVFLTGNGTLFVNNTFVEWAAVQALRRAQPRLLVTRYGVRDKMKPFSSLLLFSQPRASDQIPLIEDPVGSFVDVEQLSYYVWLSAEKTAAYRQRTLYLFLAEGVDEMLALRSGAPTVAGTRLAAASLPDVCATMAAWLGIAPTSPHGKPIETLLG
jgi:hypothetical protein